MPSGRDELGNLNDRLSCEKIKRVVGNENIGETYCVSSGTQ